jgi:hypothetical protein
MLYLLYCCTLFTRESNANDLYIRSSQTWRINAPLRVIRTTTTTYDHYDDDEDGDDDAVMATLSIDTIPARKGLIFCVYKKE